MKKFFSLALAALMCLSLLAGCGGDTGGTDTAATDEGSGTETETGGKLVVYSALNEDNTIAIADQFKKDTGIEIEYISLGGGDAVARVQAEMNNPQADFLVGGSVDLYGSLAEAGALLDALAAAEDACDWYAALFPILKLLLSNRRQIFSPQRLYEAVWEEPYYYGAGNTITVHIRNLRQKIEPDPSNPVYIKTTWGRGYHCD